MTNLDVLSVNGDTALADATYAVAERRVYLGYVDPQNANRCYVEVERPEGMTKDLLLVNDTVANTIVALNAGTLLEVFFAVTIKSRKGIQFGPAAGRSGFLNLYNIVVAYDFQSDANIEYTSYHLQGGDELIVTDELVSTITSAAADISPGAETLPFPIVSKTCHRVGNSPLPFPRTILINENYLQKVLENFADGINITATATAKLKVETVISIAAAGTGYSVSDVLTAVGGTGTAATFTVATIGGAGEITGINLTTAGSYSVLMADITQVELTGGTGTGGRLSIDFEVDSLVVSNSGAGYSSAPAVTISGGGGSGATATSTLTGDNVQSCTVTAPGNNFTSIPTVAIAAPTAKTCWVVGADQGGEAKEYIF